MSRRPPPPTPQLIGAMVRFAMARGLPGPEAEDVVVEAWEKAMRGFQPSRGSFESLLMRIVQTDCAYWWRTHGRRERGRLRLLSDPTRRRYSEQRHGVPADVRAESAQQRLLEALEPEEARVFAAWALQRHLPRGSYPAAEAARSLGLSVPEYENAKRRLRTRVASLLDQWGMSPRELFTVEDDERPRRKA